MVAEKHEVNPINQSKMESLIAQPAGKAYHKHKPSVC